MANKIATADANAVINPAIAGIQGQLPAVQQLYTTLMAGLNSQVPAQTNALIDSATRRGVLRQSLQPQAQQAFQGAVDQAGAQLGVGNAQAVGTLRGQVGQANVLRPTAAQSIADLLQSESIAKQENALKMQENQQNYTLAETRDQVQKAQAAARAAESASQLTTDQALDMQEGLWAPGKDGYVSPRAWNSAIQEWIDSGGSVASFTRRFGHLVNKEVYQKKTAYRASQVPYAPGKGPVLRYKGVSVSSKD